MRGKVTVESLTRAFNDRLRMPGEFVPYTRYTRPDGTQRLSFFSVSFLSEGVPLFMAADLDARGRLTFLSELPEALEESLL
jgi:hypothetical protein